MTEYVIKLKPCPFCGSEAELERLDASCIVRCTRCNCSLETTEADHLCGSSWNIRYSPYGDLIPDFDGSGWC